MGGHVAIIKRQITISCQWPHNIDEDNDKLKEMSISDASAYIFVTLPPHSIGYAGMQEHFLCIDINYLHTNLKFFCFEAHRLEDCTHLENEEITEIPCQTKKKSPTFCGHYSRNCFVCVYGS